MSRQKSLSEINRLLGITYQRRLSDRQLHEMQKSYDDLLAGLSNTTRKALLNLGELLDGDEELMQAVDFDSWLGMQPEKVKTEIEKFTERLQEFEKTDEGKALKNAGWIE